MVMAPVTASVPGDAMVIPLFAAGAENVREAQVAPAVLMVTVTPELIKTTSVADGVAAVPATPPAVVAQIPAVQFPVATAYLSAEKTSAKLNIKMDKSKNNRQEVPAFLRSVTISTLPTLLWVGSSKFLALFAISGKSFMKITLIQLCLKLGTICAVPMFSLFAFFLPFGRNCSQFAALTILYNNFCANCFTIGHSLGKFILYHIGYCYSPGGCS
jgi:hypothetical protein